MRDVTYRDLIKGLRALGVSNSSAVIAHASLSAFGRVAGGAEAVVGALVEVCGTVIMPAFTYQTRVAGPDQAPDPAGDAEALVFTPDLPVSRPIGAIPERFRQLPQARRSSHPLMSFAGVNAEQALAAQSLDEPLAPIEWLAANSGQALLLGVTHTTNTSIHLAERHTARPGFTRWALTAVDDGVHAPGQTPDRWTEVPAKAVSCRNTPGHSAGFDAIRRRLGDRAHQIRIGSATITSIALTDLLHTAESWLHEDPLALLCTRPDCERCTHVRQGMAQSVASR